MILLFVILLIHSVNKKSLCFCDYPEKNNFDVNINICNKNNNKLIITERKIAEKEFGNIYFNKFSRKSLFTTQYKKN